MTILIIRIMFALGVVGYAVNMYCDRILSIFPNGTIKLDNIKEIEKEGVLAKMFLIFRIYQNISVHLLWRLRSGQEESLRFRSYSN